MDASSHSGRWLNRTVAGIVLATFLSDLGHEMASAALPLYLHSLGYGATALGLIEGISNLLICLSRLAGGVLGHYVERKRTWTAAGFLITAVATGGMALVRPLWALVTLRCVAWIGRGYRGPLRDFLLSDAVEKTHYGRAYGLERAGDMLGAVSGPLIAALLLASGWAPAELILWTFLPGTLAAAAVFWMVREGRSTSEGTATPPRPRIPRRYGAFLAAVFLFGMGDFSRSFLILLSAAWLKSCGWDSAGAFTLSVVVYAGHNAISALAAYPLGRAADRRSKLALLAAGYLLGAATNGSLAIGGGAGAWLVGAMVVSGIYIAAEETLEKAAAAEFLPRESRSLGLGLLAGVNAAGDMTSSIYVGLLLDAGRPEAAFGIAAACGAGGAIGMAALAKRSARRGTVE